jgi:transcriptional/translational regulatory protein YebC/TACO1
MAAIDEAGLEYIMAGISMVPQTTITLDGQTAGQILKLMDKLEDNDDVQNVYANFDIPDEIMEGLS